MTANFKSQLERALEAAVQQHFCQLFSVLMVKPDEAAYRRFTAGIKKLAEAEETVGAMIAGEFL